MTRRFRPLDRLSSIKVKLSVAIIAAVGVTVLVHSLGLKAGLPLVLLAAASGILALGVIHVLARGMTSPLREMVRAASAMARGDYSRRVTATSRDEVGELGRAFNSMAGELAEIDRMRRDLVANVSHELRTPISALRALLENLVDGVERADPRTLRPALEQVNRLERLVAQLLDLSRLEAGVVPLERRPVALGPLLERVAGESRARAARGVRIVVRGSPGELKADADRLHQLVANLLENAVRHSPDGGEVELSARSDDGVVTIEVADRGPGIPPEETARVFERFYRADAARSHDGGGTGLGLSIARWIVELHGGAIRAEPNRPTGCRMVVTLPREAR